MSVLELKFRTWFCGLPPRPIKLEIPGWAGENHEHGDGARPQPWHCQPFVDGSTYGLELIYPFQTEIKVTSVEDKDGEAVIFEGDFKNEPDWTREGPPFQTFAPGHYGFTSSLDLLPPEGYAVRIEPHPRFYTDTTGTVPIPVPGHIQRFWPKIFFIVFKSPLLGQTHIFRYGEPYGQILLMPKKPAYDIKEMSIEEAMMRESCTSAISSFGGKIASHSWKDYKGRLFTDVYRQMSTAYSKAGKEGIRNLFNECNKGSRSDRPKTMKRIKPAYFKVRREDLPHFQNSDPDAIEGEDTGHQNAPAKTENPSVVLQEDTQA